MTGNTHLFRLCSPKFAPIPTMSSTTTYNPIDNLRDDAICAHSACIRLTQASRFEDALAAARQYETLMDFCLQWASQRKPSITNTYQFHVLTAQALQASLYVRLGRYSAGVQMCEQALDKFDVITTDAQESAHLRICVLHTLASANFEMGDHHQAMVCAQRAVTFGRTFYPDGTYEVLMDLASVLQFMASCAIDTATDAAPQVIGWLSEALAVMHLPQVHERITQTKMLSRVAGAELMMGHYMFTHPRSATAAGDRVTGLEHVQRAAQIYRQINSRPTQLASTQVLIARMITQCADDIDSSGCDEHAQRLRGAGQVLAVRAVDELCAQVESEPVDILTRYHLATMALCAATLVTSAAGVEEPNSWAGQELQSMLRCATTQYGACIDDSADETERNAYMPHMCKAYLMLARANWLHQNFDEALRNLMVVFYNTPQDDSLHTVESANLLIDTIDHELPADADRQMMRTCRDIQARRPLRIMARL